MIRSRGISILSCLLLAGFVQIAAPRLQAQAQQPAEKVAEINKLGGTIRPIAAGSQKWEVAFHLRGRELTDDQLAVIAGLKNISSLNLRDTKITGAGLAHLKGLTTLERLHLERTKVDDNGIAHLAGLVNLKYLNLYATPITDKALAHLTKLSKLKKLYVWQTKVTDQGVAELKKALPRLKVIRGVDLSKLPKEPIRTPSKNPVPIKWKLVGAQKLPKSRPGLNVTVTFENKMARKVKLYWISYGGEKKLYAVLNPGAKRRQNSYSEATWLITAEDESPLGYFITIPEDELVAVIPKGK